jgi:hypothetical protein
VILLFAFSIIFHQHHHGLGLGLLRLQELKMFHLFLGRLMFLCSLSLKQIRGAAFRIFICMFSISGRGFYRSIGITVWSVVMSSLYLFDILHPAAALLCPLTESFVDAKCLDPCTTKRIGCKVCFLASTNNEQYFISDVAIVSQSHRVLANASSKTLHYMVWCSLQRLV